MNAGDLSELPDVHVAAAGLKSLCTTLAANGMEECRKLCGGHGYSLLSGLPERYASYVHNNTAEGDNYLMTYGVNAGRRENGARHAARRLTGPVTTTLRPHLDFIGSRRRVTSSSCTRRSTLAAAARFVAVAREHPARERWLLGRHLPNPRTAPNTRAAVCDHKLPRRAGGHTPGRARTDLERRRPAQARGTALVIARSSTDAVVDASLMGRRAGGLAAVLGASGDLCASSSTPCQQSRAVARGRRRCGGALRGRLEPLARRGLCASHCPRTGPNRMHSVRMRANSLRSSHPPASFDPLLILLRILLPSDPLYALFSTSFAPDLHRVQCALPPHPRPKLPQRRAGPAHLAPGALPGPEAPGRPLRALLGGAGTCPPRVSGRTTG